MVPVSTNSIHKSPNLIPPELIDNIALELPSKGHANTYEVYNFKIQPVHAPILSPKDYHSIPLKEHQSQLEVQQTIFKDVARNVIVTEVALTTGSKFFDDLVDNTEHNVATADIFCHVQMKNNKTIILGSDMIMGAVFPHLSFLCDVKYTDLFECIDKIENKIQKMDNKMNKFDHILS